MVMIHVCDIAVSMKKKLKYGQLRLGVGAKGNEESAPAFTLHPTDLISKLNSVSANEIELSLSSSDFFPVSFDGHDDYNVSSDFFNSKTI
jgi:hypothetical protein